MLKKNQDENNNSSLATDAKDDLQQNVKKYLHSKLNDDKCLATERDKIIIHPIETNIFCIITKSGIWQHNFLFIFTMMC